MVLPHSDSAGEPRGRHIPPPHGFQHLRPLLVPILQTPGSGRLCGLAQLLAARDPVPQVDAPMLSRLVAVALWVDLPPLERERALHIAACALAAPAQAAVIARQQAELSVRLGRSGLAWRPRSLDDARALCWTMQYRAANNAVAGGSPHLGGGPASVARMLAAAAGVLRLRPDQPESHYMLVAAMVLAKAVAFSPAVRNVAQDLGLPVAEGPVERLRAGLERTRTVGSSYWVAKLAQSLATDSLSSGPASRPRKTTLEEAQHLVAEADAALKRCKAVLPRSWFIVVLGLQDQVRAAVRAEAGRRPGGGVGSLLRHAGGRGGAARPQPVCDACGRQSLDVKVCGRCRKATYCSARCQKEAWPEHRAACKAVEAARWERGGTSAGGTA